MAPESRHPSANADPAIQAARPLDGLVVLDLTHAAAGPMCSMLLADFGARVLKVEKPNRGDHSRYMTMLGMKDHVTGADYYLSLNRNKESVAIDLSTEAGRKIALELSCNADILLANFRPGVTERLGLRYEDLKAQNPGLIYCEITGFGRVGPRAQDPGMDLIAQALAGSIAITGEVDGPPIRPGPAIADLSSSLQATIGILLALQSRQRTGLGQRVDINLVDSAILMLSNLAASTLNWDIGIQKFGQGHPQLAPYQGFRTSDGWVFVACGTNRLWQNLCRVIGRDDLPVDSRFSGNPDRVVNKHALIEILAPIFVAKSTDEWLVLLKAAGVPAAPVLTPIEAFESQAAAGSSIIGVVDHPTLGKLRLPGISIKLGATPGEINRYPPRLGEDTRSVLADILNYNQARLDALEKQGVIAGFSPDMLPASNGIKVPRRPS